MSGFHKTVKGPNGTFAVDIQNDSSWSVERLADRLGGFPSLVGSYPTGREAYAHARRAAGLSKVVQIPQQELTDRRGLVEHSRNL
jgi:hypothetical protein